MPINYNNPPTTPSTMGEQVRTDAFNEIALRAIRPTQLFQPLADVKSQPRNHGKRITQYLLIALLSDANVNDQGLNAAGVTIANGNLYGSSDDVGTVAVALPALTENGGDVNRVGYSRVLLTAELSFLGFYHEYTKEAVQFDSMKDLDMNMHREALQGASEITEDALQLDLLAGAGLVRYAGAATSRATITGEGASISVVTYDDVIRNSIDLNNSYCPTDTTIITGSLKTDTRTINRARPAFISPDLLPTLMGLIDYNGNPAWVDAHKYADAATLMPNEEGSIGGFRFIANPKAKVYRGVGATVVVNGGYRATGTRYDVYPILVVGKGSFTTVGFESSGKSHKFTVKHVKPGSEGSYARDVQGQRGFMSINWYYSTMILRSEWLSVLYTVAKQ